MRNWLGIARALLCLLVGHASVTSVNDWVQGVLGPDAWNYSAQDLDPGAADERRGLVGGVDDVQVGERARRAGAARQRVF